jgi:hypothetical protein
MLIRRSNWTWEHCNCTGGSSTSLLYVEWQWPDIHETSRIQWTKWYNPGSGYHNYIQFDQQWRWPTETVTAWHSSHLLQQLEMNYKLHHISNSETVYCTGMCCCKVLWMAQYYHGRIFIEIVLCLNYMHMLITGNCAHILGFIYYSWNYQLCRLRSVK